MSRRSYVVMGVLATALTLCAAATAASIKDTPTQVKSTKITEDFFSQTTVGHV